MSKVALVSDSSAGIGHETALVLSRNGYYTYAGIRDLALAGELLRVAKEEKLPLRIVQLDVNSDSSVNLGIKKVLKEQNRIDLLVNNLGYYCLVVLKTFQ